MLWDECRALLLTSCPSLPGPLSHLTGLLTHLSAPGLYDSSGIRVYYTARLRKYDMGVLQLGFFTFPIHFIPPGAESFRSYGLCKTDKFEEVKLGDTPCLRVPVSHRRAGLIHKHTQPEPQAWTMTAAWGSEKSLPWIMQQREGVRALGPSGVGQEDRPGGFGKN